MYLKCYSPTPGKKVKVSINQSSPTLCNPIDVARQAPLSMEFCRQEYWSGLPFPTPEDLPDPGIEPTSPAVTSTYQKPPYSQKESRCLA